MGSEMCIRDRTYSQEIVEQPYVDMFDGKQWHRGDTIPIIVNPNDPSQAIHIRMMYQRALPVAFGFIIMLPAIGMLCLAVFFEVTHRDLERCDPARTVHQHQSGSQQKAEAHVVTA